MMCDHIFKDLIKECDLIKEAATNCMLSGIDSIEPGSISIANGYSMLAEYYRLQAIVETMLSIGIVEDTSDKVRNTIKHFKKSQYKLEIVPKEGSE